MGIDGISNNSFFERVKASEQLHLGTKKPLDTQAEVNTSSKADPKLRFQYISATDNAQVEASIDKTANARGSDELSLAWAAKCFKEPSLDSSITSVIDKLRSISGAAVEQSFTYKFFNLNQGDSQGTV
jgi:hypothetical protein